MVKELRRKAKEWSIAPLASLLPPHSERATSKGHRWIVVQLLPAMSFMRSTEKEINRGVQQDGHTKALRFIRDFNVHDSLGAHPAICGGCNGRCHHYRRRIFRSSDSEGL
jgi:hypothetical protein